MRIEPDSKLDLMFSVEERFDTQPPEPICELCGEVKTEVSNTCPFCDRKICSDCSSPQCYYCGDASCSECWSELCFNGDACSVECYAEATEDYSALEG